MFNERRIAKMSMKEGGSGEKEDSENDRKEDVEVKEPRCGQTCLGTGV